jgi:membrane protease YdiL (CAAX protease family)
MVLVAVAISIYLFTFSQNLMILFPSLLISTAMGLQWYLTQHKRSKKEGEDWSYDEKVTKKSLYGNAYYSIIAVSGMLATSLFVAYISYAGLGLSITNSALFGVEMAIAEEMFFRGVIFNYLIDMLKHPTIAIIGSAIIFMAYHFGVYGGSNTSLIYVLVGGIILAWVTNKSKNLVAAMFAHSINNVLAAVGLVSVGANIGYSHLILTLPNVNFLLSYSYLIQLGIH